MASVTYLGRELFKDKKADLVIYRDPFNFKKVQMLHGENPYVLLISACCHKKIQKIKLSENPTKCPNVWCGKMIEPLDQKKHYRVRNEEHIENNMKLFQAARVRVYTILTEEKTNFTVAVNPYTNEVITNCKTTDGKCYSRPKIDSEDVKTELNPEVSTEADIFFKDVALTQCGHFISLQKEIPEKCPDASCAMPLHQEQIKNIDTYEEPYDEPILHPPHPLPAIAEVDENDDPIMYPDEVVQEPLAPAGLGHSVPVAQVSQERNLITTRAAVIATLVSTVAAAIFFVIEAVAIPSNYLLLAARLSILAGFTNVSFALSNVLKKAGIFGLALQVALLWNTYAISCKEVYIILSAVNPYLATVSIVTIVAVPILYNIKNTFFN